MKSDSISKSSITVSHGNARDLANKKKKTNRSAKWKQCKLDARREQWLSQVKNKRLSDEGNSQREPSMHGVIEGKRSLEKFEMNNNQDSDWELPSNSLTSGDSIFGGSDSVTNYSGRSSISTSGSSRSGGCCSGSITEEDQDDGCLDDWEAVADALAAYDKQQNSGVDPPPVNASDAHESTNQASSEVRQGKQECERIMRDQANIQAWRPDDACRPQTLPNLTKQRSFPMKLDRHYVGGGAIAWSGNNGPTVPSSCPICYEDLDITDTSFLPCECGFRLCLFCHKRILEEDGRCPGCRKTYNQEPVEGEASVHGGIVTIRLARSCSMVSRS